MIIVLLLAAVFAVCLVGAIVTDARLSNVEWAVLSLVAGIVLLTVVLCIPLCRACDMGNLRYFEGVRNEVGNVDGGMVDAAMRIKVAQENGDLERMKYWAENPMTNWFHHGDVLKTRPIEIPAIAKEEK